MSRHKKTIIEYRHYSLALQFPVLLLSGERWRISDIKSGRLHFHNCLEIGICHSDSGIMEFENNKIPFQEGDVTCVPRHLPHTTYSSPGTNSLWSYIFVDPQELFRDLLNVSSNFESPISNFHKFRYIMNKNEYPRVYHLVCAIVEELKSQKSNYQTSVKGLMLSLYVELLRIQTTYNLQKDANFKSENMIIISKALDYIHENYMTPVTIEGLADMCHLSVSHFRKIFHEIMGSAPLDFLNSTRIDEACRLLRTTESSILSVSEQVGFHSISSFNRCFIKFLGVPPRVWRKQNLALEEKSPIASILEFTGWVR